MVAVVKHSTDMNMPRGSRVELDGPDWAANHVLTDVASAAALTTLTGRVNTLEALDVQFAHVNLTTEEVKALHTTPKSLVAAPGANKWIVPLRVVVFLDYGTATYAGAGAIRFKHADGTDTSNTIAVTATADAMGTIVPAVAPQAVGNLINKAYVADASAAITTGDSPVGVDIWYVIKDAPVAA